MGRTLRSATSIEVTESVVSTATGATAVAVDTELANAGDVVAGTATEEESSLVRVSCSSFDPLDSSVDPLDLFSSEPDVFEFLVPAP